MSHKEIRIGALYPLSGDNAAVGQSIRNSLEFYVGLVNNQDIPVPCELKVPCFDGEKVRLIWADTKGDPIVAVSEAKRLVEEEGATSIIGSYQSSVTAAVSFQTEVLQIPYIGPVTDADILTQRNLKWFFRTGPTDAVSTNGFFQLLKENGFISSTVGSLAEESLLGLDEVKVVINLSRSYGQHMIVMELYDPDLPVPKQALVNIACANPDFLLAAQFQDAIIQTVRSLNELNYYPKGMFYQTSTLTFEEVLRALGKEAKYIFAASVWAEGLTREWPLAGEVNAMFKYSYGESFNAASARSFIGIYVLIDAIARAGSTDPQAIRKALIETDIPGYRLILPWKGIRFDETGQNIFAENMVVQILNGTPKIVWPKSLAETDAVLPVPPW